MQRPLPSSRGSALIVTIMTIAIFSLVIGAFYSALTPKYRSIYQGASWQESLQGAEAGVDYGLLLLNQLAASTRNPDAYDWTANHWSYSNASYTSVVCHKWLSLC